jgi:hypothetical protein
MTLYPKDSRLTRWLRRTMEFSDKTLKCIDCTEEFVFSAGEQEFLAKINFSMNPNTARDAKQIART